MFWPFGWVETMLRQKRNYPAARPETATARPDLSILGFLYLKRFYELGLVHVERTKLQPLFVVWEQGL